ncbi:hypothetical protein ZHAS_00018158 [Anopheles sinensis]|uniref:Uncharacterized protein n=1 Tax=Anopheles sinensis TaxID=74873 RepID=A0A084WIR0_ANOSI|nr:hypothetical protein ZHAS_00018158 [Anopheles sinensis]
MVALSNGGTDGKLLLTSTEQQKRRRRIEKLRRIQHDHRMRLIVIVLIGKHQESGLIH